MENGNTFSAAEYEARVQREADERIVRVRQFIAEHGEREIDEFFDAIRDVIDIREQAEQVALSRYFKGVQDIIVDVEESLRAD